MAETVLIILGILYLIYKVAYKVPKDIQRLESKIDQLQAQLKAYTNEGSHKNMTE